MDGGEGLAVGIGRLAAWGRQRADGMYLASDWLTVANDPQPRLTKADL